MSSLYIQVEPIPGSGIEEICMEAVMLSENIGINIRFNFNGVECLVSPDGDCPKTLAKNWEIALKSKKKYKIATANH